MLRLTIKNSHLKMFYKFLTPILFNNLGNESNAPVLSYVSDLLSTFSSCFNLSSAFIKNVFWLTFLLLRLNFYQHINCLLNEQLQPNDPQLSLISFSCTSCKNVRQS